MIQLTYLEAGIMLFALLVAGFALGVVYGGAWIGINVKLDWCYQWAHDRSWEMPQADYMRALEWCDAWKQGKIEGLL